MTRPIRLGAVAALREQLRGRLVSPDDTRYDAARKVWNGRIDRRPSLVAFCADEKDVVVALRLPASTSFSSQCGEADTVVPVQRSAMMDL